MKGKNSKKGIIKKGAITFSIVCLIVFVIQTTVSLPDYSLIPSNLLERPLSFLVSIFMHGGAEHLVFNLFGLLMFGYILEKEIGTKRWIGIFFLTGSLANLGYITLSGNPYIGALGASGAIFGIIGTLAALKPKMMVYTPFGIIPMSVAAILWGVMDFIMLGSGGGTANSAHLFGLAGGLLIGLSYRVGMKDEKIYFSLILIPLILSFGIATGMKGEIEPYKLNCSKDNCSLVWEKEEFNFKAYMYDYGEGGRKLVIISPARGGFEMGGVSERLKDLAWRTSIRTGSCEMEIENIKVVNENSGYISGQICNEDFKSQVKYCKYKKISLTQTKGVENIEVKC